jgi:hypothetical protein
VTLHRLEEIVGGDLDEVLDSVHGQMTARALAAEVPS